MDCQYKDSQKEVADNSCRYVSAECNYIIGIERRISEGKEWIWCLYLDNLSYFLVSPIYKFDKLVYRKPIIARKAIFRACFILLSLPFS